MEAACARCGAARGERILANPCALAARQPDRSAVIYSNETAASSSLTGETRGPKVIDVSHHGRGSMALP